MSFIIFLVLIIFIVVPVGMQLGLSDKFTSEKKAVELIEERKRVLTTALIMFIIESILCVFIMIDCFGEKEILGFNYYDFGEGVMCVVFAVMFSFISIPGVLYTLIRRVSEPNELQEDLKKFLMEEEKKKCQQMAVEQKFSEDFELLVKKYGNCDKIIKLGDDIEDCVIAFSSSQQLFIKGDLVTFDSILKCYLIDNDTTITTTTGRTNSTTQNNTGSTIGRAVVGGVVAGGVGAIVAGTTAKKETTSTHRSTSVTKKKHDYVIVLEIRDIAQPIIKISCAENEEASCEILGMVNAIISLNQQ